MRNASVAHIRCPSFRGFPACAVRRFVRLIELIGLRNRLFVLINWAGDYLFYGRAVRLIKTDDAPCRVLR